MQTLPLLAIGFAALLLGSASAQIKVAGWEDQAPKYPEPAAATKFGWLREYMLFIERLSVGEFARGYPALIEKLNSDQLGPRIVALKAIGELGDPASIPYLVPILRNSDRDSQVYAGLAIEKIVSAHELGRRGSAITGKEYIEAPKANELDLKPMRWIVFEMLTSGEPNIQSYAVTMAGYLDLEELKPVVEALKASKHPAVTGKIDYFIGIMERSKR